MKVPLGRYLPILVHYVRIPKGHIRAQYQTPPPHHLSLCTHTPLQRKEACAHLLSSLPLNQVVVVGRVGLCYILRRQTL